MGIEIIEWGCSFDASAAATPGQVDLVEVDVAASAGTASIVPCTFLSASISAAAVTTVALNAALQPAASTNFELGVANFVNQNGANLGSNEVMQVTAGGSTTTVSVLRAVNDSTAATTYPVNTVVYALPGTGVYSDIQPYSAMPTADPTYGLVAQTGTALTGFSFGTYNTPLKIRQGDFQLLPPTAPYVKQFPLERGFEIHPGRYGQIRCQFPSTVNAWAYMIFQA
jgi:hypothetical protein